MERGYASDWHRCDAIRGNRSTAVSTANGKPLSTALPRVRIGGKFFTRTRQRFRVQGVTYGPFAPNADGEPFPAPDRVTRTSRA